MTLTGSTVSGNSIRASGGARGAGVLVMAGGASHVITNSLISDNDAISASGQAKGGGAYLLGGYPTATSSTISGNTADVGGGAFIYYATATLKESTVSGNTAQNAGGIYNAHVSGYYGGNGPVTLHNSTVTANVATAATATGGVTAGILDTQTSSNITFKSSIVAGNSTPNADPAKADLIAFRGAITGVTNLIGAASGITLPSDTISAEPLLGPLQDNGGPTPTHALLPGSPAIDAGSNPSSFTYDQRGEGYARVIGPAADIGAFETQQIYVLPVLTTAFVPDTIEKYGIATLTIEVDNANDISGLLTADLVDTLPASVVIADPSNASTTCVDAVVTAVAGQGSITLASGTGFPANDACTVTVSVTSASSGSFVNTMAAGALQTNLGNSAEAATATLTVINALPATQNDSYTTAEDTTLDVAAPGVLANDTDADGDMLTAILAVGPSHGTLTLNADGSFTYAPAAGFYGSDGFTYLANDGEASTAETVAITVKEVNSAPVALGEIYTVAENGLLTIDAPGVLANDTDADGDTLTAIVGTEPAHGALWLTASGGFVYAPTAGFFGTDSFTYVANDGQLESAPATVSITVTEVVANDVIFSDGFESDAP